MAAGNLDPAFGAGGVVTADVFAGDSPGRVVDTLLLPDGRWLALGVSAASPPAPGFTLARFNADGSPDPSFGGQGGSSGGGRVTHAVGGAGWGELAVQPDGKVVVGGTVPVTAGGSTYSLAVARCDPDGTLDPSFGGGGWRAIDYPVSNPAAGGVVVLSDGNLVVGGGHLTGFVLARLRPDGSPDPTFGADGNDDGVASARAPAAAVMNDLVAHPDGGVVAAGTDAGRRKFLTAHFRPDGSAAGNGVVDHFFYFATGFVPPLGITSPGEPALSAEAAGALPDGSYIVAGTYVVGGGREGVGAMRVGADGAHYSAFARQRPHVTIPDAGGGPPGRGISAQALAVLPDGRFVTAGRSDDGATVTVVRHNASGIPDTTFGGGDGRVVIPGVAGAVTSTVAFVGDKLMVAMSLPTPGGPDRLALVRLDSTSAPPDVTPPRLESVRLLRNDRASQDYQFELTFSDDAAVSVTTMDLDRLLVTGPKDYVGKPFPLREGTTWDGPRATMRYSVSGRVVYRLNDTEGRLDTRGRYVIQIDEGAAVDTSGNPLPPAWVPVRMGSTTRQGAAGRILRGSPGTAAVDVLPTFDALPAVRLSRDGRSLQVTLGIRNQTSVPIERRRTLDVYATPTPTLGSGGQSFLLEQESLTLRIQPGRTQRFRLTLRLPESPNAPADYYLHFLLSTGDGPADGLRNGTAVLPRTVRVGGA